MPLTAIEITKAKPKEKTYRLPDGRGLYLEVRPSGAKFWRYRYELPPGKESIYSIGEYPAVSLKEARDARDWARRQVSDGISPTIARDDLRRKEAEEAAISFEMVGREWFEKMNGPWTPGYAAQVKGILETDIYPAIGRRPISRISSAEVLKPLDQIEKRGATTIALLARQFCSRIFRYGIARQYCSADATVALAGALRRKPVQHHPILTLKQIPILKERIASCGSYRITKIAMEIMLLTMVRTAEMRKGLWTEIHWDDAEWRPTVLHMKKRRPHIVPLSRQAIELFRELFDVTGGYRFMLPSYKDPGRKCMSVTTINTALARMGYGGQFSGHGFRGTASTALHEAGYNTDHIEMQLAHLDENKTRMAYNHALYLPERRKMMQDWADMIDAEVAMHQQKK